MKIILLPTPSYGDLSGWTEYLRQVQAQDEDVVGRDAKIMYAEAVIAALTEHPPQTPPQTD